MEINKEILSLAKGADSKINDILGYLVLLEAGIHVSFIPFNLIKEVGNLGIFYFEGNKVVWNIPLYEKQENKSLDKFDWVKAEYVPLFVGKVRYAREATARMKKLFAENPDIRKEEVLGATEMYVNNTNPLYLMFPHYFIEKGTGANKTQSILHWIDEFRESEKANEGFRDDSRRLL